MKYFAISTVGRAYKVQHGDRVKDEQKPMFTLTSNERHGVVEAGGGTVSENIRIRRLTPRECWRLQGFPDEYYDRAANAGVSETQLYKQAGNAVTVTVARAIGEKLKEAEDENRID